MPGVKHDQEKPMMDLLDPFALEQVAKVLTFGAEKYGKHNWREGIAVSRLIAAGMRHILAFNNGETLDEESGLPHLAHAMCCLMFATWMVEHKPDLDDRYQIVELGERFMDVLGAGKEGADDCASCPHRETCADSPELKASESVKRMLDRIKTHTRAIDQIGGQEKAEATGEKAGRRVEKEMTVLCDSDAGHPVANADMALQLIREVVARNRVDGLMVLISFDAEQKIKLVSLECLADELVHNGNGADHVRGPYSIRGDEIHELQDPDPACERMREVMEKAGYIFRQD